MASETNGVTGEQVVYQYDSLNRLIKAASSTEGQSFVYDGFGNLVQKNATAGTAPTVLMTVDPTTNRITSMGGSSTYSYDNNGNVLLGPTVNTYVALAYDVRNGL